MRSPEEDIRNAVERFLAACREPVLLEEGEAPFAIAKDQCVLTDRQGSLMIEVWDDARNLARRVTAIGDERAGRMELRVERFGKRTGAMWLIDSARPANRDAGRRSRRFEIREQFRQFLRRQFPGWTIAELSTGKDLEHSLPETFPRALVRHGATAYAAMAAAPDAYDPAAVLTYALIWFDYLRRREPRLTIEGLAIFAPAGAENVLCLRLRRLNANLARIVLYRYSEDGFEERVDPRDSGNIDTVVAPWHSVPPSGGLVEPLLALPGVDCVPLPAGALSLRVNGLEFARWENAELRAGLDSSHAVRTDAQVREAAALARELARLRSAGAADRLNPLYLRQPERWLEAQLRGAITEVQADLLPSPIYTQAPALAGVDRGVLDLLAVTRSGRLAVIEVKASEDMHLPLQALDYWIRVEHHRACGDFHANGYFSGIPLAPAAPTLLLVAPALCFHPSNEIVLRYFDPAIEVTRVGVALEWQQGVRVLFRHSGNNYG